jgi:hypothetical protein
VIIKQFTITKVLGFSLVLYVEYDPKVHTPTTFVCPWQDPRTDTTSLICPQDIKEGTLVIVPSYTLHYATPNLSNKIRTVISADLLPKLPDHQSINNLKDICNDGKVSHRKRTKYTR